MSIINSPLVLVTGATGFIACQVIKDLYDTGRYRVRGTTRDLNSEKSKRVKKLFPDIELVVCSLTSRVGWSEALNDASFVIHLASPYHSLTGGKLDDFVKPATQGTLHVLEGAMKEKGIKRVVITSSITAVAYG